MKRLQNGKVEAIFVRPIRSDVENLEVLYTRPDTLVAAYKPGAFFQDEPEPGTSFERLSTLPLSMLERSLPAFSNAFREKGLTLSPKYVSTRMQIALNWARTGKAVVLAPKSAMEEFGFTDLAEKTVEDCDLLVPAMTILTQKRKYRSHLVNNFLLLLSERYGFEYSEPIEGSDNGKGA